MLWALGLWLGTLVLNAKVSHDHLEVGHHYGVFKLRLDQNHHEALDLWLGELFDAQLFEAREEGLRRH